MAQYQANPSASFFPYKEASPLSPIPQISSLNLITTSNTKNNGTMVRKPSDEDLDADELSFGHETMRPPRRPNGSVKRQASNANGSMSPTSNVSGTKSTKNAVTKSSSRTASFSPEYEPSVAPTSNSARKRAAPTASKAQRSKRAKVTKLKIKAPKRDEEDIFNEPERLLSLPESALFNSDKLFPVRYFMFPDQIRN